MNKQRKFSNIRLTQQFHSRHMGLWVAISVTLVMLCNVLLYVILMQQWGYSSEMEGEFGGGPSFLLRGAGIVLTLEALFFAAALVLLGKATSHRIAGAFLGMQKTCERVTGGERTARQKFRTYDGLADLEKAFNAMLDALTGDKSTK